uniref:NADH-ubiquinone oxidoreductase chain 3 n=1 Tax=Siboglinum ekmani TaxID=167800 RepID=A0A0E3DR58_9ANNE|nr:NADH dehydrogenase subunit 3 [Siboglinum ekmani]
MNMALIFFITSMTISTFIFFLSFFLNMKMFYMKEKFSAYECGFDSKTLSRIPFSMQFFLISILFLIFDVEIILISPIPFLFNFNMIYSSLLASNLIILILLIGLIHEWHEGSLTWMN